MREGRAVTAGQGSEDESVGVELDQNGSTEVCKGLGGIWGRGVGTSAESRLADRGKGIRAREFCELESSLVVGERTARVDGNQSTRQRRSIESIDDLAAHQVRLHIRGGCWGNLRKQVCEGQSGHEEHQHRAQKQPAPAS